MLSDTNTYKKLKGDPTKSKKNALMKLLKDGNLSEDDYIRLRPTAENVPKMYGLPKIHKPSMPLRPIVSYSGTINHGVARLVATILGPLMGKTIHHIKNSKDLWIKHKKTGSGVVYRQIDELEVKKSMKVLLLMVLQPKTSK